MEVRRLRRITSERKTNHGTVETVGKFVIGARRLVKMVKEMPELVKEIPRLQAYGYASSAIFHNVEAHRMEHFMRLVDIGLGEEDPKKGRELIEHVEHIAKAYGKHRGTPLQREILTHVRHIEEKQSEEMLRALGEVANHLKHIKYNDLDRKHAEIILRALTYARGGTDTPENLAEKRYVEWMSALKEPLEMYRKGQRDEAIAKIQKLVEEWRRQLA